MKRPYQKMFGRCHLIRIFFPLLVFFSPLVLAGSFKVTPIRVFLDAGKKTAVLTVTNNRDERATLQLEAFAWSQDENGEDRFTPTRDIVLFPKIFSIEKNEERIVRIGYQGGPAGVREKPYRLYLQELPVSKSGETAIHMTLRIGVPIFISPLKEVEGRAIEGVKLEEGRLQVKVKNSGNSHILVSGIKVTGSNGSGAETFSKEINGWSVLSGSSRSFYTDIPQEACEQSEILRVSVNVARAQMETKSEVDKAQCGRSADKPKKG